MDSGEEYSSDAALLTENKAKNRYGNIIACENNLHCQFVSNVTAYALTNEFVRYFLRETKHNGKHDNWQSVSFLSLFFFSFSFVRVN